jgi:hypothetical protein
VILSGRDVARQSDGENRLRSEVHEIGKRYAVHHCLAVCLPAQGSSVFIRRRRGRALRRGQTDLGERGYYRGLQPVARAEVPIEQIANHGKARPRP